MDDGDTVEDADLAEAKRVFGHLQGGHSEKLATFGTAFKRDPVMQNALEPIRKFAAASDIGPSKEALAAITASAKMANAARLVADSTPLISDSLRERMAASRRMLESITAEPALKIEPFRDHALDALREVRDLGKQERDAEVERHRTEIELFGNMLGVQERLLAEQARQAEVLIAQTAMQERDARQQTIREWVVGIIAFLSLAATVVFALL